MPSHTRDASRDRELVVRNQSVPMWDSSDPDRAPPPLPMNPGSPSTATKSHVSPGIQAVAANFAEKKRDNVPSPYTTNQMTPKPLSPKPLSPEKSLIKGQFHKRMQSLQNTDTRSEFLNYLENRSPERPQRASTSDLGSKELGPAKPDDGKENHDPERELPNLLIPNHYLSKPILGESTPPSATMLALQNMQLPPPEDKSQPKNNDADPFSEPRRSNPSGFEGLSTQILSLTDIASNLQREMAQLSRRSKDNATDLISLKAATNARDEDIRKSLRDLSSNLATKFLDPDASRWDSSTILGGSESGINNKDADSSPNSKRSYSAPRMPSPNPFAALERDLCGSSTPISDGSASIALLEKMLREMATKEGQEKLVELVDEIKARPASDNATTNADTTTMKMLEEILNFVKEDSGNKALVRSQNVPNLSHAAQGNPALSRSRSLDPDHVFAPDMEVMHGGNGQMDRAVMQQDSQVTQEMLSIMKRVKNSVIEGGGMTNEVKHLVRELRGEVLGMGRNIARQFEQAEAAQAEAARAADEKPQAPGPDEISAIVNHNLAELKHQLASIIHENRQHSSGLSELHSAVNSHNLGEVKDQLASIIRENKQNSSLLSELHSTMSSNEIYSIVRHAVDDCDLPQGATMQKEDILETVREAWETYKPEIELQNFGLERDEILDCLKEGLKAYQPQHEQAVTYDQVLAAVQAGVQSFEQPPSITKEEIVQTIQECLEASQQSAPRSLDHDHLGAIKDDILQAVTGSVTSQSALTRESLDSGLGRDDILTAVSDGIEAHFTAAKEMEKQHISREDVVHAINDAFATQHSALSTNVQPPAISRDEILSAIAEGLENQNSAPREIELNKDDLMEAISAGLHESTTANQNVGEQMLERLHEHLEGMKEMNTRSGSSEEDTERLLNAIKDGIDVVRHEVEGYAATATEAAGKHEIMDTVKEGFRLLQADMEKTITETALTTGPRGNPDTPELLDAMEKEFDHLRQTLSSMLLRNSSSSEKDEILDAIREASESHKSTGHDDLTQMIKHEFESLRDSMSMSLVRSEPTETEKDKGDSKEEIIAALRESLDKFKEETGQPRDNEESVFAATGGLLDAFNDGFGTIREDLAKLLEKPEGPDHSELLEALKEGLVGLKADVEALRESHKNAEEASTSRGGELMLANESNMSGDIEGLKSLISQLQTKVEAIEASPRAPEPSEDALKKEHLDEVLAGLHELQGSITGIVARETPTDETIAKKEDTDAIETLLRNTKSQLDEMKFPAADEVARAEQLGSLESLVTETKEAITELCTRLEAEGPTKSEIGTLETLMKDMWVALDELKGKGASEEGQDDEKLVKADLQTVEAMIFEVKTQVDELKIPDPDTLPTKNEIQDLSALVAEFRDKTEAENELTGQGFEARKVEHAGLAEKIEEARALVEGVGDELKSKLDGSHEGLTELKQILGGLAITAENFSTAESVNELRELINREFERARGEQDAGKLEKEERDAASMVKHDETRAAIIVELGAKIDEKLGELMSKYDEVHSSMDTKFSESADRDNVNLEAVTSTKSLAEDIKLVIGSMGNTVNDACERMSVDTKTFFEKVDASYTKMEEMHGEVRTHQEQAVSDLQRTAATTDRLESKLHEFHPQVLESIQEILSIVGQHYDHSQKSAESLKSEMSLIPATIPQMLPALPAPEPEKYDDSQVQEKLNHLLDHAKNDKVADTLNVLVERVTSEQVHQKLDQLMSQTSSTHGQIYDKLSELLDKSANSNGPVHEKLDTLIGHATNNESQVTQMMKLDEMHKDIMETSRRMNEMFAAQSAIVAEDNERKRREAEEAAVALERRNAQREQAEAEIVTLKEEKDSLLKMLSSLKAEKENLVKQNAKMNKELSGLEMALDLRHEEMQVMEERADSLEKRILEGVLDHARSVLLSRPKGPQGLGSLKKTRASRGRGPSATSTASIPKEARNLLGNSVGLALKKRASVASQTGSQAPPNTSKERRILSLSHVTGNRGVVDRQASVNSGLTNLKRSHSVKSNFSHRKASWGGRSSIANKENEAFPEEEEHQSGDESDAGTERRTSYTGTYAESSVYGTESVVSTNRRDSVASSTTTGTHTANARSVAGDHEEGEEDQENMEPEENEENENQDQANDEGHDQDQDQDEGQDQEESDFEDAQTTKGEDPVDDAPQQFILEEESSKMVVYGNPSDSGLGAEVASAVN